jgi:hypothetical protein
MIIKVEAEGFETDIIDDPEEYGRILQERMLEVAENISDEIGSLLCEECSTVLNGTVKIYADGKLVATTGE